MFSIFLIYKKIFHKMQSLWYEYLNFSVKYTEKFPFPFFKMYVVGI